MTTEISNSGIIGQPMTPGEETKTGAAQTNLTQSQSETGKPATSIQITENAQRLQSLHEAISSQPVVDPKRVEAAANKVQQRAFDILGDAEKRLQSAQNIAQKLLDLDNQLPAARDFDEA